MAISRPPKQKGALWNDQDLDGEEAILPNNQGLNEPSDDEDDHVSKKVSKLAQEFSNLVDEKMNKTVSVEALQQLALIVCSACWKSYLRVKNPLLLQGAKLPLFSFPFKLLPPIRDFKPLESIHSLTPTMEKLIKTKLGRTNGN